VEQWLNPPKNELPDDFEMPIWDHLDELRERVLVGALAAAAAVLTCFIFSKDLVVFLEAPVAAQVQHACCGFQQGMANPLPACDCLDVLALSWEQCDGHKAGWVCAAR
jgi:Sec-independent protein secretion pathway component TatC